MTINKRYNWRHYKCWCWHYKILWNLNDKQPACCLLSTFSMVEPLQSVFSWLHLQVVPCSWYLCLLYALLCCFQFYILEKSASILVVGIAWSWRLESSIILSGIILSEWHNGSIFLLRKQIFKILRMLNYVFGAGLLGISIDILDGCALLHLFSSLCYASSSSCFKGDPTLPS